MTFDNCRIKGNSYQTTSYWSSSILLTGSSHNFSLTNSRIQNGSASIYMYQTNSASPSENMVIDSNQIENSMYYQVYLRDVKGFHFEGNTITNDSSLYGG